ncbi:hypothetical protein D3C87_904540 [compost metagenome]
MGTAARAVPAGIFAYTVKVVEYVPGGASKPADRVMPKVDGAPVTPAPPQIFAVAYELSTYTLYSMRLLPLPSLRGRAEVEFVPSPSEMHTCALGVSNCPRFSDENRQLKVPVACAT